MLGEQASEELVSDRLNRIEVSAAEGRGPSVDDANFLLRIVRRLGDQRVMGLREAAGLIRAAKHRETTTRFLVGKREQAIRASNSKLMDVVANLIDQYAQDAEDWKI